MREELQVVITPEPTYAIRFGKETEKEFIKESEWNDLIKYSRINKKGEKEFVIVQPTFEQNDTTIIESFINEGKRLPISGTVISGSFELMNKIRAALR